MRTPTCDCIVDVSKRRPLLMTSVFNAWKGSSRLLKLSMERNQFLLPIILVAAIFPAYPAPTNRPDIGNITLVPCSQTKRCRTVPSYPLVDILKRIRQDPGFVQTMASQLDPKEMNARTKHLNESSSPNIPLRQRRETTSYQKLPTPICDVQTGYVCPQKSNETEGNWKFVFTSGSSPCTQLIQVEICRNENASCTRTVGDTKMSYTQCKQTYIRRTISVYDADTRNIYTGDFDYPAGCQCYVTSYYFPFDPQPDPNKVEYDQYVSDFY